MFIVNHPGSWQHYVNRPDNKGLNIMEIKSKYLQEQLLFEQYMSFQMQQQMANMLPPAPVMQEQVQPEQPMQPEQQPTQ